MKMIPVSRGKYFALVDDEDYDRLMQWKWFLTGNGYAVRKPSVRKGEAPIGIHAGKSGYFKLILMHRVIMNTPADLVTDHINGNTLDNRKANLRVCTDAQNARNQKTRASSSSGYKGVTWSKRKKKWQVSICVSRKQIHLGFYSNKEEAAKVYNEAAVKYHGHYARQNII